MPASDDGPIGECRDRRRLGRLVSHVEKTGVLPDLGPLPSARPRVVGITGPAGAGKSTLVGALLGPIRASGAALGVLLVDPSSPVHGGALLGDRIRIEASADDPDVFVRSIATRGAYGGIAAAVPGAIDVLGRAGFAWIVVETVGIGQTDVAVAAHVDTVVLVTTPEGGDEVQTEKSGVIEVADILVVNKADRPGAGTMAANLRERVARDRRRDGWVVPVIETDARSARGIDELWRALESRSAHAGGKAS